MPGRTVIIVATRTIRFMQTIGSGFPIDIIEVEVNRFVVAMLHEVLQIRSYINIQVSIIFRCGTKDV